MLILLYVLVGLGVGVISGTLGIGGGVLLVPMLVWFFHHQQTQAQGITLAVLAVPVVLPAVWQYYVRGLIHQEDLQAAGWIALGFLAGGLAGASFVHAIPVSTLRVLFGLILIYIAVRFLLAEPEDANVVVGLTAVGVAWLVYYGLRLLGRRHRAKPDLGETLRNLNAQNPTGPDYYI